MADEKPFDPDEFLRKPVATPGFDIGEFILNTPPRGASDQIVAPPMQSHIDEEVVPKPRAVPAMC